MNPNINRHRSPTQKNIPAVAKSHNYLSYSPMTPRGDKHDMHSSTEQSTKQEQSSREHHALLPQPDGLSSLNSGFYKVKKEETNHPKNQSHQHGLKLHHSEKTINFKTDRKIQTRKKVSPQKYNDYFGFKNTPHKLANEKLKIQQKLSDSGDSQFSQNSKHSNNTDGKNFRFLSKRNEKKIAPQETRFRPQIETAKQLKQSPQFLEGRNERKAEQYEVKDQYPFQLQTPRKESPSYPHHAPKKQENPGGDTIYKRSSLTPQNKLTLNRQNSYETNLLSKNHFVPKKVSPLKPKQKELEQEGDLSVKNNMEKAGRANKYGQLGGNKEAKGPESKQFSFSKDLRPKYRLDYQSQQKIPKRLLSLPVISIFPLWKEPPSPVSFIVLEKLAENKSSSILKVLHPATSIVFCLKKSAASRNVMEQLIVEHKVSTSLAHPNLVRAFATFYDRSSMYLLMEYMDGRSLHARPVAPPVHRANQEESRSSLLRAKDSNSTDLKLNRLSFKQKPNFREDMFSEAPEPNRLSGLLPSAQHPGPASTGQKLGHIRNVVEQVLEGLCYLHENNIIHRDLKPDNIFVSHNNYKIGDFGSCTYTNSQEYIGTLDYAAPEIMLRQRYDRSIDLWSLGCLTYQLDVGRPPFYHYDRAETIRRIANVEYDEELVSSPALIKFISKLLVKTGRISANEALMEIKMLDCEADDEGGKWGARNSGR